MKKITALLTGGNIDIAIALTISMLEPKKTLALNTVLMHCLQEADFKHAEKVVSLLNRDLSNFELKIFVDKDLERRYFNGAKEISLKMSEPNRTKNLVLIYHHYSNLFFNNGWHDRGKEILEIINLMAEPSRTSYQDDFFEGHLRHDFFVGQIVGLSRVMNRIIKIEELNRAFKSLYNMLTRRDNDSNSNFDYALEIIKLMPKPDRIKSRDLLLGHYLQKPRIDRLNKLAELLEEPELSATLNIIFNHQLAEKNEEAAIKTADKMIEPYRSIILGNYLNEYVSNGLYEKSLAIAGLMNKELDTYQLYRITRVLIEQKYLEKAWELAKKLNDSTLKSQILNQLFERDLAKGYFGKAYEFAMIMRDEKDKTKAAHALFNKVIVATQWLSLCGDLPKLFTEADRPTIIKKVQARGLNEGNLMQIVNFFKDGGLDKINFDKLQKRVLAGNLVVSDFQDLLPILSGAQKSLFLATCVNLAIKSGNLGFLKKLQPFISEKEKITACKKMAHTLVRAGELDKAKLTLQLVGGTVSQSDLEIILKKNIADGLYDEACEVAVLLGIELTLVDLDTILKKCLALGQQKEAEEVAIKILA